MLGPGFVWIPDPALRLDIGFKAPRDGLLPCWDPDYSGGGCLAESEPLYLQQQRILHQAQPNPHPDTALNLSGFCQTAQWKEHFPRKFKTRVLCLPHPEGFPIHNSHFPKQHTRLPAGLGGPSLPPVEAGPVGSQDCEVHRTRSAQFYFLIWVPSGPRMTSVSERSLDMPTG